MGLFEMFGCWVDAAWMLVRRKRGFLDVFGLDVGEREDLF